MKKNRRKVCIQTEKKIRKIGDDLFKENQKTHHDDNDDNIDNDGEDSNKWHIFDIAFLWFHGIPMSVIWIKTRVDCSGVLCNIILMRWG